MPNKGNISKNFTWDEVQYTSHNINNTITDTEIMLNVQQLVNSVLQPLRDGLNRPIKINSCYRSPQLNELIGGAKNSQHMVGEAADIVCDNLLEAFEYIRTNLLFDQLIWEVKGNKRWIHVSYRRLGKNRNQVLVAQWNKQQGKFNYVPYNKAKPII